MGSNSLREKHGIVTCIGIILLCSGDIKQNSGPASLQYIQEDGGSNSLREKHVMVTWLGIILVCSDDIKQKQNLKFAKTKSITFTKHIWNYNNGDYDRLRGMASTFDWDSLKDNNIDT